MKNSKDDDIPLNSTISTTSTSVDTTTIHSDFRPNEDSHAFLLEDPIIVEVW